MTFEQFCNLLNAKNMLQRIEHSKTGIERDMTRKTVERINSVLRSCEQYDVYMSKLALESGLLVG